MAGLTQLLNVGITGLQAATQGMQTVANNTANVNTPGYNVQSVVQSQLPGVAGDPGSGVVVNSVQRAFDQYIYQQMVSAGSVNQAAQAVQTNAQSLATMFPVMSGGANGLGAALSGFFAAINQLGQDPNSSPNRQVVLGSAQTLVSNFVSIGTQLAQNLSGINDQIGAAVQQVNALTQQIAALNRSIATQPAGADPPNSLLDTRDNLVRQLAQQIGITLSPQSNGSVDIYTNSGALLVGGDTALRLGVTASPYGDGSVTITYEPTGQDLTSKIAGGTIGGLLTSRAQTVAAEDSIGAIATTFTTAINAQQALGLTLGGTLGGPLFTTAGPAVFAAATNTGSGSLSAAITDGNAFIPGDFTITRTASGFSATNLATGQTTSLGTGPTLSLDGMTIAVSGTAAIGDSFKLEPTARAAAALRVATTDASAIAAASAYVATPGANLGTVTASAGGPAASGSLPAGTAIVPASQFGTSLTVKFTSPTAFEVLSSSNAVLASGSYDPASGGEIAIDYPSPAGTDFTILLSAGQAATSDSFALTPGGPGSNGNVLALAGLATQNLLSGQSLSDAYASTVAMVGSNGQAAGIAAQTAQGVLSRVTAVQQSISGVNLDEQAADLVNFQQAYQAAATVIGTSQTLFDSLLAAVRA